MPTGQPPPRPMKATGVTGAHPNLTESNVAEHHGRVTVMMPRDDAPQRLRAAGLRVTETRLAVYGALGDRPHSTAAALIEAIADGDISKQGVYNVLEDLTAAGLVRRIEPAGSPALFELRVGDNHHHLVCRICGRTEDVDCAVGAAPCLAPSTTSGFVLDEAEVVWWGRCADCAQDAAQ
jgi:Fe2+ or Zn2+ uptake regulation protein